MGMNGMLSTRIAQFDRRYLDDVEERLNFHAGGPSRLFELESNLTAPVDSMAEIAAQYRSLRKLGAICRRVESELRDYSETAYCSVRGEDGESTMHEEATLRIGARDLLDERFAYVRAIYGDGILTF
jgi:hypothetical protein